MKVLPTQINIFYIKCQMQIIRDKGEIVLFFQNILV